MISTPTPARRPVHPGPALLALLLAWRPLASRLNRVVDPVGFVMSRKMLRTIRSLAEGRSGAADEGRERITDRSRDTSTPGAARIPASERIRE